MDVLSKLEKIRERLNKGEDVLFERQTFTEIIQESKAVNGWNKTGLLVLFGKPEARLYVTFETKGGAFVQVVRVEMPGTLNTGALFEGKVSVLKKGKGE